LARAQVEPPVSIRARGNALSPTPDADNAVGIASGAGAIAPQPDRVPVNPPLPDRTINERVLRNPDELVPVGQAAGARPPVDPSAPRHYTAQPGDTVSRLAGRFYGTNNKANRDLIINANPPLQAEGNPVIVGKVYVLPSAGLLPTAPFNARCDASAGSRSRGADTAPAAAAPAPIDASYYNGQGERQPLEDRRFAAGNPNAWTTIRDMNADVLKGGENVIVNMRLRLPSKAIVSASAN